MSNYGKKKPDWDFASVSWWVITIVLCMMPYFGIPLFCIRALMEKKLHRMDQDPLYGPAVTVIGWCGFSLILSLIVYSLPELWLVLALFGAPLPCGILMLVMRSRNKKLDNKYRLCQTIIYKGHVTDPQRIGECLCLSAEETLTFLEEMIQKDLLPDCSVNREEGRLMVRASWAAVTYTCGVCNAVQQVNLGFDVVCKYCGNPISRRG